MQEPRLNRSARQYKNEVLQSISRCDLLDPDPDDVLCLGVECSCSEDGEYCPLHGYYR